MATESDNVNEQNIISQEQNLSAAPNTEKGKKGLAAITGALTRITEKLNFWIIGFVALIIAISGGLIYQSRKNLKK